MSLTVQQALNTLFPGNQGITQGFGVNGEAGVDIGAPAGTPVPLFGHSEFLGSLAGGYVAVFDNLQTGLLDYYQHIVASPALKAGSVYDPGTVIGTVAPLSDTPAGYSSTGPHLEFGTASSFTAGAAFPTYSYADPTAELIGLAQGGGSSVKQPGGGNWWDAITGIPGDVASAAGSAADAAGNTIVQVENASAKNPLQALLDIFTGGAAAVPGNSVPGNATGTTPLLDPLLTALGLPTSAQTGAFLKKWGLIVLLSIGALLLVLELFRSEDH